MPQKLTFEEFVYKVEWDEVIRLSQFVGEFEIRRVVQKKVREHRRGKRPLFRGPCGEQSEWAGMCRNWYQYYLAEDQNGLSN